MTQEQYRWDIDPEKLADPAFTKLKARFDHAKAQMDLRNNHHELYGLLAKNQSIHNWMGKKSKSKHFSEGSTQYILRKTLADTIQRCPDGELVTQYDKLSWQHIITEYIFHNKIMWSEYEGIDMMSNLTNTYKMSFIYGYAPVRIGFERDYDDDVRVGFNLENWADVFINPDCRDIRRPQVVYHRSYMSADDVQALLTPDGELKDSTYDLDTVRYIVDHKLWSSMEYDSEKLADKMKGSTSLNSVMLITEYRRDEDEFITYCEKTKSVFRRIPNCDPRKGIPWVFCVLEPDPDFPLGVSQVEFLLADQQFNDLFQTSAYKNLLLALEPPIMVSGWETNPSSYKFEPRKIWNLGNNPNQVKVEPVKIDNSILGNWTGTREAIAASMMRNVNAMDGTVASDSGTSFSKTAPGVEMQQNAKTININQYQKRIEYFVSDWANMALRCYLNSMTGEHLITVDEETRRKLFDIQADYLIEGDKVRVDFSELSTDLLSFQVRAGSLVELKEDQERAALAEISQPIFQNLNAWSDQNRPIIENKILLPMTMRMLELSDADLANTLAESLRTKIAQDMMGEMQGQIDQQQMQLDQQQLQMDQMAQAMQAQQQGQQAQAMPAQMPVPELAPDMAMNPEEAMPSEPQMDFEEPYLEDITPGQQVLPSEDLLSI